MASQKHLLTQPACVCLSVCGPLSAPRMAHVMIMVCEPSQVVMLISLRKPLNQQSTVPKDSSGLCPMKLLLTHPCFDA
jgi:hypothetical protein